MSPESHYQPRRSLVAAMVLQYAVGGAIIPFITLLLRDRGLSVEQISLVLLVSSAALLASPFVWGMLADRFLPLNRLFGIMNLLSLAALAGFGRQKSVAGLAVLFTLFYACFQPAPMLVNALCFRHLPRPLVQFAPLRMWGSVGWILPSLPIFVWLFWRPAGNFEFILYVTMALSLGMAGLSLVLPATPPGAGRRGRSSGPGLGYAEAVGRLLKNPNYLVLLISYFLISASFTIQAFYSPPRLADLGLSRAWMGPVQSIGVAMEILMFRYRSVVIGHLSYAGSILFGCLVLTVRQLLFAYVNNLPVLAISYLLVGVTVVFYHIGVSILVDAIATVEVKATAQTLLVLCGSGLGPMFANGAVGGLARVTGPDLKAVFLLGSVLAGLASGLIWWRSAQLVPHGSG